MLHFRAVRFVSVLDFDFAFVFVFDLDSASCVWEPLRYGPSTRVWEPMPPMICMRGAASAVPVAGVLLVTGGRVGYQSCGQR